MVILIFNHTAISSGIEQVTGSVVSAAEMLVAVSGVIVGIVFGARWRRLGGRATTGLLLRRARKLYLASAAVVGLVGILTLVPWLGTEALVASPTMSPATDSYAYGGWARTLLAIITLEAGPWQFNILGFFIAVIALSPLVLWALDRGAWPLVLLGSLALYLFDKDFHPDPVPFQSERPFPLLTWQILFVGGIVLGWHRAGFTRALGRWRRPLSVTVAGVAAVSAAGLVAAGLLLSESAWSEWELAHFDKGTLDGLRIMVMMALTAGLYLIFRHFEESFGRLVAPLLLPLGQNSFYVFIVHVFWCLAVASIPVLAAGGLGAVGNSLVEITGLLAIWLMVKRRFLFRWIPR